uniref:BTB domain-containing protein n=1 Tax=Parastrongyloides trichosuri TaxID=131310 RepID=A0A0N4ZI47_PARTI
MDCQIKEVQEKINEADSLEKICNIIESKTISQNVLQYITVRKTFQQNLNYSSLTLQNPDNVTHSSISCTSGTFQNIPIETLISEISRSDKINRELPTYVGFIIENDTRQWSEDNKNELSKRYAGFAEFLLESFPSAKSLRISDAYDYNERNDFSIYVIEKLKSKNVEDISLMNIMNLIKYLKEHNVTKTNLFKEIPNLKKISLDIHVYETTKELEDIDEHIMKFVNCLKIHKNVILKLNVEDNIESKSVVLKILNTTFKTTIDVRIFLNTEWKENIITKNLEFTNDSLKIVRFMYAANIYITKVDDFTRLKLILTYAENLEALSVYVENDLLTDINSKFKNLKDANEYIKSFISFHATIGKLKKLSIYASIFFNDEADDFCMVNSPYEIFINNFIIIFPSTILSLSLSFIESLSGKFFNIISENFPSLHTLVFLNNCDVPGDCLFPLKNLRHFITHRDIKIAVPPWIEIVIYCYYDSESYNKINDNKSEEEANEFYFNLIGKRFNYSIRRKNSKDVSFVAFLSNIKDWNKITKLADE